MANDKERATFTAPSKGTLLKVTGAALVVAAGLLVLFVLPAEYGIDYTGFGRSIGLTELAQTSEPAAPAETTTGAEESPAPDEAPAAPQPADDGSDALAVLEDGKIDPWEQPPPPQALPQYEGISQFGHFHDAAHKTNTVEVSLEPGEEVEFKINMEKGEPLLFSWSIPDGDIYYDFHGEPMEGNWPEGFYARYGEGEAGRSNGSFVAPFTGRHGWYWLNYNEEAVTIRLTFKGYYESYGEIYRASRN